MTTRIFQCPDDHAHGRTTTCYFAHSCGCDSCMNRMREQQRLRRRRQVRGLSTSSMVEAESVWEHLQYLAGFGYGYRRVSQFSGVAHPTVRAHMNHQRARIEEQTAEALLGVKPTLEGLADGALVPARGAQRRIRALGRLGWTRVAIGERMGCAAQFVSRVLTQEHVTARVHWTIDAVFSELWATPAPDSRRSRMAIRAAVAAGDPGPLDWDDIDYDPTPAQSDGDDTIDEVAIELAMSGERVRLSHAEKIEGLLRMHPLRWSNHLIADRLGCDERTVNRLRVEISLPGWDQTELVDRKAA